MLESLKAAVERYIGFILHAEDEWNVVASEKPPVSEILFPFTTMGVVVLLIASALGCLLRAARGSFLLEMLFTVALYAIPLAVFTAATSMLAGRLGAVRADLAVAVCLYAFSPAWLVSALHVIPVVSFGWLWLTISLVFVSLLFVKGSTSVLGIPDRRRPLFIAACLVSLVLTMAGAFLLKYLWLLSKEIF
jgi:hypothetical protein